MRLLLLSSHWHRIHCREDIWQLYVLVSVYRPCSLQHDFHKTDDKWLLHCYSCSSVQSLQLCAAGHAGCSELFLVNIIVEISPLLSLCLSLSLSLFLSLSPLSLSLSLTHPPTLSLSLSLSHAHTHTPPHWSSGYSVGCKSWRSGVCTVRIFSGCRTSDLKSGTPVATLPGAWCYRVWTGLSLRYTSMLLGL